VVSNFAAYLELSRNLPGRQLQVYDKS